MSEPRIPTHRQLRQRDRQLLERIKPLIGGGSMSAAASFVFDNAGEQIVAWLEDGTSLKIVTNQTPTDPSQKPISRQPDANGFQPDPNGFQPGSNGFQPDSNGSQPDSKLISNQSHDAIDDLDILLGN